MARPRQFQEHEAVGDALQTFWKQGYQGTSIPDLLEATGLERGSLYKAFGDKHSLFEKAIGTYLRSGRAAMRQILNAEGSPLDRLHTWITHAIDGCSGTRGGPGCLAVNAMIELAPSDAKVRARLARHWSIVEGVLERTLTQGQRVGEIRDDLAAPELARIMIRMIAGIAAFSRQGARADVGEIVIQLLTAFPGRRRIPRS
jgi:TetR/AcrR family transcriptional repressor of nem operon